MRIAYAGKRMLVKKLRQAYQLAATSIGLTEGFSAIQLGIEAHLNELHTLQQHLQQVAQAMTRCLASLPEAPFVRSILGEISAAMLLAEVGDPGRYQAAAQWVKLAGI